VLGIAQLNKPMLIAADSSALALPSVQARLAQEQQALQQQRFLQLPNLPSELQAVQDVFCKSQVAQQMLAGNRGSINLCEVFSINKALPSQTSSQCSTCYRIEAYNYTSNTAVSTVIDMASQQVLNAAILEQTAPDIPEHLKQLAVDIASNNEAVKTALGYKPASTAWQMAYTKTALNQSKCERSLHLCVAPTFVQNDKALWTIVDLTDLRVVGTRWTNVGDPGPVRISERKLQNEVLTQCYCEVENKIDKMDWRMSYMLTSSDGLRIADVQYKGKQVLRSAKLVDWHVSYSKSDGFGYSDGVGCPYFSLSAVVAWDAPTIADLVENGVVVGFVLEQVFRSEGWPGACNYNYVQRYAFYKDGRFRPSTASIGRGCGNDGMYRPVLRIAFAGNNTFSQFNGNTFNPWQKEQWTLQDALHKYTTQGEAYRINGSNNYGIVPSRGQFSDGGRGDYAYVYVSCFKQQEGEEDLVTIGPCCNNNFEQGPEKFLNEEAIDNKELVLWYVPQMHNDDRPGQEYCWAKATLVKGKYVTQTYPCFAGPMFVPIK
jgi:hypothetical protein